MFAKDEYPILERVFKFICDVECDPDIQTWVNQRQTSAVICEIISVLHKLGYEISPATPETVAAWEKDYLQRIQLAIGKGTDFIDEGKSFLNALLKE